MIEFGNELVVLLLGEEDGFAFVELLNFLVESLIVADFGGCLVQFGLVLRELLLQGVFGLLQLGYFFR